MNSPPILEPILVGIRIHGQLSKPGDLQIPQPFRAKIGSVTGVYGLPVPHIDALSITPPQQSSIYIGTKGEGHILWSAVHKILQLVGGLSTIIQIRLPLSQEVLWVDKIQKSHHLETMVETIRFVGICRGIKSLRGSLGGTGFRPSTVYQGVNEP